MCCWKPIAKPIRPDRPATPLTPGAAALIALPVGATSQRTSGRPSGRSDAPPSDGRDRCHAPDGNAAGRPVPVPACAQSSRSEIEFAHSSTIVTRRKNENREGPLGRALSQATRPEYRYRIALYPPASTATRIGDRRHLFAFWQHSIKSLAISRWGCSDRYQRGIRDNHVNGDSTPNGSCMHAASGIHQPGIEHAVSITPSRKTTGGPLSFRPSPSPKSAAADHRRGIGPRQSRSQEET